MLRIPLTFVDGYNENAGGIGLTPADSVNFVRQMANLAAIYGIATGLKNSQGILPQVSDVVAFAVNEQCSYFNECALYNDFLASGKPVFNIEYNPSDNLCSEPYLSTVYKHLSLDGYVKYCDGSHVTTPTK
jgi:hypothetical protein